MQSITFPSFNERGLTQTWGNEVINSMTQRIFYYIL